MGREVKLAQPLVLSTDVWTPGPFDQILILRRIKFGGPPPPPSRFPRHRNAKCPKMSQRLGVSRQTSPYLSSTSKQSIPRYTKRHSRLPSLHSTQQQKTHIQRVTLIKTIPSPPTTLNLTPTIQPTIHSPKCPSLNHHLNHRHPSPPSPKNSPPSSSRPSPSRPSRH